MWAVALLMSYYKMTDRNFQDSFLKLFAFLIRILSIEDITSERVRMFTGREAETMSGFFFTPITRFYAEMMQGMGSTGSSVYTGNGTDGSFFGTVQDKLSQMEKGSVAGAGERDEAAIQAMSMEAYKLYIYQKISGIPMNDSQKWDAVSVNISEEGFAAMKADPAYEKWVLDTLRSDFSYYNPWSSYYGGSYRSHYFGATKEEYRGESFHMGFRNGDKRTESKKKEESFWDKRAKRRKLYMDLAQKAWYKHDSEKKYQESIDLQRRELSSARLQQWSLERATGEKVELDVNPSVLSEAATEYAQEYVFFKIPSALMNARPKTSK